MKQNKFIAFSLIASLILSGSGQVSGTSQKAYAAQAPVSSAVAEPSATPVPTPLPSVCATSVPTASWQAASTAPTPSWQAVSASPTASWNVTSAPPTASGSFNPYQTADTSLAPGQSPTIYQPRSTGEALPISEDFYFNGYYFYFNRAESKEALIEGNFIGLHDMYIGWTKLERGVDYIVDTNYIRLTEHLLKNITNYSGSFNALGTSSIKGVDVRLGFSFETTNFKTVAQYEPEYPLSETKNFYTTYAVSQYYSGGTVKYGMDELKLPDHLLLDHKELLRNGGLLPNTVYIQKTSNIGEAILVMNAQFYQELEPGVHFIEYVVDGKSEVLQFVRESRAEGYKQLLEGIQSGNTPSPSKAAPTMTPMDTADPVKADPASFSISQKKFIYNEGEDNTIIINGNYKGLHSIYYQNKKLTEGIDYVVDHRYVKFTEDFLEKLPFTENKFTAYGTSLYSGIDAAIEFTVIKVDYKIAASYEPRYPLSDTKNCYTSFSYSWSSLDTINLDFGMKEMKVPDEIYFDRQRLTYGSSVIGGEAAVVETENVGAGVISLSLCPGRLVYPGVHYIEVVTDGKSEVLTFIREDQAKDYLSMLVNASYPALISSKPTPTASNGIVTPTPTASNGIVTATAQPSVTKLPCGGYNPTETVLPCASYGPTGSPEPPVVTDVPYYENRFWIQTKNLYAETYSDSLYVEGSYEGLKHIYFENRQLVEGTDYTLGLNYSTENAYIISKNLLRFSGDFLDTLPYGENLLDVYADYNPGKNNELIKITITKTKDIIQATYTPEYPLSQTKNFTTGVAICKNGTDEAVYGISQIKDIDKIYLDHQPVLKVTPAGSLLWRAKKENGLGSATLHFNNEFFADLPVGVHTIEAVTDGTSEVIYLVKYDNTNSSKDVFADACKQEPDRKLQVDVTTSAMGSISQFYRIKQVDSVSPFNLDKLKIRYYYEKDGAKTQTFTCDNAGISLNVSPYYVNCTDFVNGTFTDDYVEIGFDDSYDLSSNTLQLAVRLNQSDWTAYTNLTEGYAEVYYDGMLVYSGKDI